MPTAIHRSEIENVSYRIAATIARQSHNDYQEPVWGDGRSRLAAQQVRFAIEDFLHHNHITITE